MDIIYTTAARILGVAGLSSEDVSDTFLADLELNRVLSVELFTWLPNHADIYLQDTESTTAQLRNNSDCLVLWCSYYGAARVLDAALIVKSRETDGKNAFERFSSTDLMKLADAARKQAGVYRQALLTALDTESAPTPMAVLSAVAPSYDPVTG
ncbi:hypothetical protein [Methylovulum miyakonense]|uniref:hypothetical protein n=1 Tax=Methylovulum miyakonense TaxID=645578 RepID=UPI00036F6B2F|nr:hypothetical protein [Methylovulum miyakonense]